MRRTALMGASPVALSGLGAVCQPAGRRAAGIELGEGERVILVHIRLAAFRPNMRRGCQPDCVLHCHDPCTVALISFHAGVRTLAQTS